MGLYVSGLGIVSNIGIGKSAFWKNFNEFSSEAVGLYENKKVGFVDLPFDSLKQQYHKHTFLKDVHRVDCLALVAIQEALEESNIINVVPRSKIGIFCGTAHAETQELEHFYRDFYQENKCFLRKILCGGYHNLNSFVASFFNISGPRYTVATACSSSLLALKIANLKLQQDENLEAAIVYGVDAFSEMVFHGFLSLGAMSDDFCKPFYRMEGMNLGEAGVAVVLTKNKNFKSNYGYLKNVALNCDAYHITASNPEGLGGAKLFTLLGKELSQKIDIIIAHGSGTQSNDMSEYTAIQKWKNLSGQDPLILATKGATGHTLGAAGLLNFALGSLIIKNDIVPKMPNITAYKESFFQDFNLSVVNKKQKVNNIFVNAFGFGGNNSVALLCKHNITNSTNFVQFSPKIISAVGLICRFGCNIDDFIQAVLSDSLTFYSKKNCSFSKEKCSLQDFRISDENYKEMRIGLRDYEFIKRLDRASTCLLSAISQIEPSLKNKQALGIVLGTGTGPSSSFFNYYDQLVKSNFKRANSIVFPNTVSNTPVSYSSMKLKCKGPSILLCDGAVSSSNAFEVASLLLSNNDCPHVICGSFDEYSETLEKAYLDIGLVKSGHSHIGCNLGELYATFALSNFTKQEQVGFGIYNGSLYSEHATPGPHRYSKDYKYILEVIESALKKFGNPDLVIYNKKNKQEHDALLQNAIEAVLKGCICYSPTEQFGYLLGGHTSLAAIIAISCFRSNEVSYKLLKTDKKIHNVFVLTLNDGGMFKVDNFVDHVQ